MEQVVATFSQLARGSSQVNQRSGVSVRLSVSNLEVLGANALRRGLRAGEHAVVPRICDLGALAASTSGKVEIESLEEGREGAILENLVKGAVLTVFKEVVPHDEVREVIAAFDEGTVAHTGEDVASVDEARLVEQVPALRSAVAGLTGGDESPGRGGRRRRVRARGPAPQQAAQQGRLRHQRDLPQPRLRALSHRSIGPAGLTVSGAWRSPARRPRRGAPGRGRSSGRTSRP